MFKVDHLKVDIGYAEEYNLEIKKGVIMTQEADPNVNPPESGDEVLERRTEARIEQMREEVKNEPLTREMARQVFEEQKSNIRLPEDAKIKDFDDMLHYISMKMGELSGRQKVLVEKVLEDLISRRESKSVEEQIREIIQRFGSFHSLVQLAQEHHSQSVAQESRESDAELLAKMLNQNPGGMTDEQVRQFSERLGIDPDRPVSAEQAQALLNSENPDQATFARNLLRFARTAEQQMADADTNPEMIRRAMERGRGQQALGDEEQLVARVSSGIEVPVNVKDTLAGLQQWADEIITEAESYDQDFGSSLAPTRIEEIIYASKALKQASERADIPEEARSYAERAEWLTAEFEARMNFHQNYLIDKNTTNVDEIDGAGHKLIRTKHLSRIMRDKRIQRVVMDLDTHGWEVLSGRSDAPTEVNGEWNRNGITRGDARRRVAQRIAAGPRIKGVNTRRVFVDQNNQVVSEVLVREEIAKTGSREATKKARALLFDLDVDLEDLNNNPNRDKIEEAQRVLQNAIGYRVEEKKVGELDEFKDGQEWKALVGKERLGERVADIFGQLGLQDRLRVKPGQDPKIMENPDHPDTQVEFYGELMNGPLMRRRSINHFNWAVSQRTTGFMPWYELYDGITFNNQGFFQLLAYEIFKEERLKYIQSKNGEWRAEHSAEASRLTDEEVERRVAEDYNQKFIDRFYGEYTDEETGERKKGLLYGVKRWTKKPGEHGHDGYYVREKGIPDLTWFRESLAEGSRVKRKIWKEEWVVNKDGERELRGHWEKGSNSGKLGQDMTDFAQAFSKDETKDDQGRTALERIMDYDLSNVYEKMFSVWHNYNFVNIEKWRSAQYASENNKSFILNPNEENLRNWVNTWGYRTDDQPKMRKQALKNLLVYNARDKVVHTGQPNLEYAQNEGEMFQAVVDGIITQDQANEAHHEAVHELYSWAPGWAIDIFLKYKKVTYYVDLMAALVAALFEVVSQGSGGVVSIGGGSGGHRGGGGGHH